MCFVNGIYTIKCCVYNTSFSVNLTESGFDLHSNERVAHVKLMNVIVATATTISTTWKRHISTECASVRLFVALRPQHNVMSKNGYVSFFQTKQMLTSSTNIYRNTTTQSLRRSDGTHNYKLQSSSAHTHTTHTHCFTSLLFVWWKSLERAYVLLKFNTKQKRKICFRRGVAVTH